MGRTMAYRTPEQEADVTRLTNEMCSCGHSRLLHGDTVGGLAKGHGRCFVGSERNHCECEKFTWTKRF